jgi:N-acetylglucosaminyldiphosphoundecaprenol N-acetyl-beta-D-mannosaminyltransferase
MDKARLQVGRVPVDPVTLAEAVERIAELARTGQGGTVYTPNVDHVVVADSDPEFRAAYANVSLALVDGTPVFWAGRLLGHRIPEKVSGSDLFEPLVARAAAQKLPVFLLGGGPGVAELARDKLTARHPGLRVVGVASPRIDARGHAVDEHLVIEQVRQAQAALVFVACGAPKSELFSHRLRAALKPSVLVCVGAAIDFAAGTAKRAPRWISRAGLEWAYRLIREPRRLAHRYLVRDPKFFCIFGLQLVAHWRALLVDRLRGTQDVTAAGAPAPGELPTPAAPSVEPLPRSQVRPVALPATPEFEAAAPESAVAQSAVAQSAVAQGAVGLSDVALADAALGAGPESPIAPPAPSVPREGAGGSTP